MDKLTAEQATTAAATPDDPNAGQRQTAKVDPMYREPEPVALLALNLQSAGVDAGIVGAVVERITMLEAALKPFAMKAVLLGNAQMCLAAQGRGKEPCGGTWVNGLSHTSMTADPQLFFTACDVYGRGRTEEDMLRTFAKIQEAANAMEEKGKHVEDFGKVH